MIGLFFGLLSLTLDYALVTQEVKNIDWNRIRFSWRARFLEIFTKIS